MSSFNNSNRSDCSNSNRSDITYLNDILKIIFAENDNLFNKYQNDPIER